MDYLFVVLAIFALALALYFYLDMKDKKEHLSELHQDTKLCECQGYHRCYCDK